MQHDDLDKLRKLVFDGGFDDESKQHVIQLENQLRELAQAENIAELPVVKEFVEYLSAEISRCKLLLSSDERLNDVQRAKLFAIIQVSERYTSLFDGSRRASLDSDIKHALNVARS